MMLPRIWILTVTILSVFGTCPSQSTVMAFSVSPPTFSSTMMVTTTTPPPSLAPPVAEALHMKPTTALTTRTMQLYAQNPNKGSSSAESSSSSSSEDALREFNQMNNDMNEANRHDRRRRRRRPRLTKSCFAVGDELVRLRADLDHLRENLQWAEATQDVNRIQDLILAIQVGEGRDPDRVYSRTLESIATIKAKQSHVELTESARATQINVLQKEAQSARACIARFQLDGLWIGNFGDEHGQQLVNVTYVGDTLVATKVTGDRNVPRGQVSFTANLAPARNGTTTTTSGSSRAVDISSGLEPLQLSFSTTSSSSGNRNCATTNDTKKSVTVPRYPGKGQVAKPGFVSPKYVDGQLVLFDRHFSFVWIPSRHHVLFRRPTSPTQLISMLRDDYSKEDEIQNMRDHLTRCLDMDKTDSLARYMVSAQFDTDYNDMQQDCVAAHENQQFRRIATNQDLVLWEQEIQSKKSNKHNHQVPVVAGGWNHLWQVHHKWREYVDSVLLGGSITSTTGLSRKSSNSNSNSPESNESTNYQSFL